MSRQMRALYAMHSIDWFASMLIGIMVPIYFISLGFSLAQIFTYLLVLSAAIPIFFFAAGSFSTRFGLKGCLMFRLPFQLLRLGMLFYLPKEPDLLFPIALANAVQVAFYWFPFHVIFAQSAGNEKLGKQVGKLNSYTKILGVFAPLIGALISARLGFDYLFVIAGITFLLTLIPFAYLTNWKPKINFHPELIIDFLKKYKRVFIGQGIETLNAEVEGALLPLFIFITFNNIISAGFIGSLLGLGGAIFTLFIGHFTDKHNKKILRLGAVIMILIWILRFSEPKEFTYFILSIIAGFTIILISIPFSTINYSLAKSENIDEYIIFREIPAAFGRIAIYAAALAITAKINYSFLMAAVSLLYFLFI